jgi:hypothetical protein
LIKAAREIRRIRIGELKEPRCGLRCGAEKLPREQVGRAENSERPAGTVRVRKLKRGVPPNSLTSVLRNGIPNKPENHQTIIGVDSEEEIVFEKRLADPTLG